MSDHQNSRTNYEKMMSKRWCGIKGLRLNSRRFSVHRLRTNLLFILRVFNKWKNSYNKCVRLLRRNINLVQRRRRRRRRNKAGTDRVSGCRYTVVRTMNHSNSFCSEAIADCLEFIKRNSVSIDDDTNPMIDPKN